MIDITQEQHIVLTATGNKCLDETLRSSSGDTVQLGWISGYAINTTAIDYGLHPHASQQKIIRELKKMNLIESIRPHPDASLFRLTDEGIELLLALENEHE